MEPDNRAADHGEARHGWGSFDTDPTQLRMLIDTVAEGLLCVDLRGRCTFVNRAACDLLGWEPYELVGRVAHDLVHHSNADGSPYPAADCVIGRTIRTGKAIRVEDEVLWRRDGNYVAVSHASVPILRDGVVIGAAVTFTDITQRKHAERALRRQSERLAALATRDYLTGLANRAHLMTRLDEAISRGRRNGRHLAVLFCDLDGFKTINDTHGHLAGDELLTQAARRIRGAVRPSDVVARFGGDEFVLVCEDLVDDGDVPHVANRIRATLQEPFHLAVGEVAIDCSVGFVIGDGKATADDLIAEADKRMYARKRMRDVPRQVARVSPAGSRVPHVDGG
jgi:diguanylate cyclase (GGDEF)-like protein/PAS domain S-box-containing protein